MSITRLLAGLVVIVSTTVGVPAQAGAAGGPSYAGNWMANGIVWCSTGSSFNEDLCNLARHSAGRVIAGVTWNIVSDAAGNGTFQLAGTISGTGNGVSPECNANLFTFHSLTGLCTLVAHGSGSFAFSPVPGSKGPLLFEAKEVWMTFYGTKVVRDVHNPAGYIPIYPVAPVPGYYHDAFPGYGPLPASTAGFHDDLVVARY